MCCCCDGHVLSWNQRYYDDVRHGKWEGSVFWEILRFSGSFWYLFFVVWRKREKRKASVLHLITLLCSQRRKQLVSGVREKNLSIRPSLQNIIRKNIGARTMMHKKIKRGENVWCVSNRALCFYRHWLVEGSLDAFIFLGIITTYFLLTSTFSRPLFLGLQAALLLENKKIYECVVRKTDDQKLG